MLNRNLLPRMFQQCCNVQDYAKSFAKYLNNKTQIMREVGQIYLDLYRYGGLYNDDGSINTDAFPRDYWYQPIKVSGVKSYVNGEVIDCHDDVFIDGLTLAKSLNGAALNDDGDQGVALVNVDEHDITFPKCWRLTDALSESTCTGSRTINLPYDCIDELGEVWTKGTYENVAVEGKRFIVNQQRAIYYSISNFFADMADNNNMNNVLVSLFDQLSSNTELTMSDIQSKLTSALGDAYDRIKDKVSDYVSIAANTFSTIEERVVNLMSYFKDKINKVDEENVIYDDDASYMTFCSDAYTGTPASAMWSAATAAETFAAAMDVIGKVIKAVVGVVVAVVKSVVKLLVKLWKKYIEPSYISKDFVKSEYPTKEKHIDVPLFQIGSLESLVPYDVNALQQYVAGTLNERVSSSYVLNKSFTVSKIGNLSNPLIQTPIVRSNDENFYLEATVTKSDSSTLVGTVRVDDIAYQYYGPEAPVEESRFYANASIDENTCRTKYLVKVGSDPTVVKEFGSSWDNDSPDNAQCKVRCRITGFSSAPQTIVQPNISANTITVRGAGRYGSIASYGSFSFISATNGMSVKNVSLYAVLQNEHEINWERGESFQGIDSTIQFRFKISLSGRMINPTSGKMEDASVTLFYSVIASYQYDPHGSFVQYGTPVYMCYDQSGTVLSYTANDTDLTVYNRGGLSVGPNYKVQRTITIIASTSEAAAALSALDWNHYAFSVGTPNQLVFDVDDLLPHDTYDLVFNVHVKLISKYDPTCTVNTSFTIINEDYSVTVEDNQFTYEDVYYDIGQYHQYERVKWSFPAYRLYSMPIEVFSSESIQALMREIRNPIDDGCALVIRMDFVNIQMISRDNKIYCNAYLNPLPHKKLFKEDGTFRFRVSSDSIIYEDEQGNIINFDDNEQAGYYLVSVINQASTDDSNYDAEEGDVEAYKDVYCAYYITDLLFNCICHPDGHLEDWLSSPFTVLNRKTIDWAATEVTNQQFVSLIYGNSLGAQNASMLFYMLLANVIFMKPTYMKLYYLMKGTFPEFFPYMIGESLSYPKWHISTDDDIQAYVNKVVTALIVTALVIIALIIIGTVAFKVKKFFRKKKLQATIKEWNDSDRASNALNATRAKQDQVADLQDKISKAKESGADPTELQRSLTTAKKQLLECKLKERQALDTFYKNSRAADRWSKLGKLLGQGGDSDSSGTSFANKFKEMTTDVIKERLDQTVSEINDLGSQIQTDENQYDASETNQDLVALVQETSSGVSSIQTQQAEQTITIDGMSTAIAGMVSEHGLPAVIAALSSALEGITDIKKAVAEDVDVNFDE